MQSTKPALHGTASHWELLPFVPLSSLVEDAKRAPTFALNEKHLHKYEVNS